MTIVAWDGRTLAADRRIVDRGFKGGVMTKIHRWSGGICGFAGAADVGVQLIHWLKEGGDPSQFPSLQESSNSADLLVIHDDRRVAWYERSSIPMYLENRFHAMGSGRDYALAAMHLGKNARKAVEVAIALDNYCGNGIDTLDLKPAG